MKIRIITKKFTLTDDVREWVEKKLAKFDKFFSEDTEATVALMSTKIGERVEVTIYRNGSIFRSEIADKDYKCALDTAMENIERQIRKNKTRLEKRSKEGEFYFPDFGEVLDEDPEFIVRTKEFELFPMSVEEAIMQMNLIGHQFFVFFNDETCNVSVVYTRKDGTYGLINPIIYK